MGNYTVIRSRAPLRLGFAGGGTDVAPYSDTHGGAVINVTIDKYAYASISARDDGQVNFRAVDLGVSETFAVGSDLLGTSKLALHRGVYERMCRDYNSAKPLALSLTTHVDAPLGSGLGSSSALVVAMVGAFSEQLRVPLGEYEMARLAFEIERVDMQLRGGAQDQYAATFGGFNFMEFYAEGRVLVNPLRIRSFVQNELESSLLLAFTGASRESAKIIKAQSESVAEGGRSLEAMHQLKSEAFSMKEALLFGSIDKMAEILASGWDAKKRTSSAVSTPEVERLFEVALGNGAKAGKLSGAGGGGFAMFLVDPDELPRLKKRIAEDTFATPVNCRFSADGQSSWYRRT